jgi:uncharacterized protein YqgV (UPF0045/DUF77 family)
MTSTIEISLYPLNKEYPSSVLAFLKKLKAIPGIEIQTNGMSTLLTGPYDQLWQELGKLMQDQFETEDSIFVMKGR